MTFEQIEEETTMPAVEGEETEEETVVEEEVEEEVKEEEPAS